MIDHEQPTNKQTTNAAPTCLVDANASYSKSRVALAYGVAACVFALALMFDEQISKGFSVWCQQHWVILFVMKQHGYLVGWVVPIGLGALLLVSSLRSLRFPAFLAALLPGIMVLHLLKYVFDRPRPEVGSGPYHLAWLSVYRNHDAFPSGHTTLAFLVALLVGLFIPRIRYLMLWSAALVALSRVGLHRHWPSDVVGGVVLASTMVLVARRVFGLEAFSPITRTELATGWPEVKRFLSKGASE